MIDKNTIYAKLAQMVLLSEDWDGFDSRPITEGVYRTARKFVEYVDPEVDSLKAFCGVNTPGSCLIEIQKGKKTYEFNIIGEGTIFFDEVYDGIDVGSGVFMLSKTKVEQILNDS